MSANPSTRWYWNDWDNDLGLKTCSLAAQGLWMRILSIAARDGGFVRVSGKSCSNADIAKLVGHPLAEVENLVAELEAQHVFSRTRQGTIYNRRMLKDSRALEISQKNGKLGGNPSLRKQTQNPPQDNPTLNPPLNGGGSPPIPLTPYPLTPLPPFGAPIAPKSRGKRATKMQVGGRGANGTADLPSEPWPQRLAAFQTDGLWLDFWGPKPGEPGCFAPIPKAK